MTANATLVAAVAGTISGSSASTITCPTVQNGDKGIIVAATTSSALFFTSTGWTNVSDNSPNTSLSCSLLTKDMSASDSGTTITVTGTGNRVCSLIVYRTADTSQTPTMTTNIANSNSTINIGSITPATTDALVIAALGINYSLTSTPDLDALTGWTKRAHVVSTNGTGRKAATCFLTKDAAVAQGVASGATTLTAQTPMYDVNWVMSIQNGSVAVVPGWQMGSIAMGQ